MPVQHTAAGDRWRKKLLRPDGALPPRIAALAPEQQFWRTRIQHTGPIPPDAYSGTVYQAVKRLARSRGVSSVLEIGPGWGNYTFRLARDFPQVTCVDLSPDNLAYLERHAAEQGAALETICAPWETAEAPRRDMVFAYNCFYRVREPELFLDKLHRTARRLCVAGMNAPPELPWLPALEKAGLPVHYTRQGCRELGEILTSMGISHRLLDLPNRREYRYPNQAALLDRVRGFLTEPVPDRRLLSLVMPFHQALPDGSLLCRYPFTSQLLVWEPALSDKSPPVTDAEDLDHILKEI